MQQDSLDRRSFIRGAAMGLAGIAAASAATRALADEAPAPADSAAADASAAAAEDSIPAPIMAEPKYASTDPEYTSDGVKVGTWRIKPEPIADISQTYEADVIVVGHGYAGLTACREIAEEGHSVILVEKQYEDMYIPNGNAGGVINAQILLDYGVPEVDPVEFFNNWMHMCNYTPNADLVMKYAQNAGANTDWYLDRLTDEDKASMNIGFHGTGVATPEAMDQGMRDHIITELGGFHFYASSCDFYGSCSQSVIHGYNREAAKEAGAEFYFNREAQQLVQAEDGTVSGVVVKNLETEEYEQFNGRAVVLATGGFGNNEDMVKDLLDDVQQLLTPDEAISLCNIANRNGDGIRMAYWAGAKLEPQIATMGMRASTPSRWPQGIWLNPEGKRYCNEFFPVREMAGIPMAWMQRGDYYAIYDANLYENVQYVVPSHASQDPNMAFMEALKEAMDTAVDSPEMVTVARPQYAMQVSLYGANTIEELFAKAGVTDQAVIDNAKAAIERYNGMCEAGVDSDYGRDASVLFPVKEGPYYMTMGTIGLGSALVTMGGIITDGEQRALNSEYKPIPGLYCSGNTCGRRFGREYMTPISGVSLGMAWTLGRECGKSVCKDLDATK